MAEYNLGKVVGDSAYELAVKDGYEGSESEWLEDLHLSLDDLSDEEIEVLQSPAIVAAQTISAAEDSRVTAEVSRTVAEAGREEAEEAREEAEADRVELYETVDAKITGKLNVSDIAQTLGSSELVPMSQKTATKHIDSYNVSVLYPTSGVDDTEYYDLESAVEVLNSNLDSSQKTVGVKLLFTINTTDGIYQEEYIFNSNVIYFANAAYWCYNKATYNASKDGTQYDSLTTALSNITHHLRNIDIVTFVNSQTGYQESYLYKRDVKTGTNYKLADNYERILCQRDYEALAVTDGSLQEIIDANVYRLNSYNLADISQLKSDVQIHSSTGVEYEYEGSTTLYIPLYASSDTVIYILGCNYNKGVYCFSGSTYLGYITSSSKTAISDDYYQWSVTDFPSGTTKIALAGTATIKDTVAVYLKNESNYYEYGVTYEDVLANLVDDLDFDITQTSGQSETSVMSQKAVTENITSYNVSVLYPTSGIDGSSNYDLQTAISVLNTQLSDSQKTPGVKLLFNYNTTDGTYQEEYMSPSNSYYFSSIAYWSYNKAMYNASKDGTQYESLTDALSSVTHHLRSVDVVSFVNSQTGYQESYLYKRDVKTGNNHKTASNYERILCERDYDELVSSDETMQNIIDAYSYQQNSYNLADYSQVKSDIQIHSGTGVEYTLEGASTLYIPLYASTDTVLYVIGCNYSKGVYCFSGSTYLGYVDSTSKTVIDGDYYHWSITNFIEGTTQIALTGSATMYESVAVYLKNESNYYEYGESCDDILASAISDLAGTVPSDENINNLSDYRAFLRQDEIFVRPNLIDSAKCDSDTLLSDYIYVSPGKTYYLYGTYYLGSSNVRFHDIDKNLLSDGGAYDSDAGTITISSSECAYIQFKFVSTQHITSCMLCEEGYRGQVVNCNYRWIPRRLIFNPLPAIEVWGDSQAARPYQSALCEVLGLDSEVAIKYYSYGGMTTSAISEKFLQAGEHNLPVVFMGMTNDSDIESSIESNRKMIESLGHENYVVCSRFFGAWNEADSTATTNDERKTMADAYDERLSKLYGVHYLNFRELFEGMGYNFYQVRLEDSFVQPAVGSSVTIQLSEGGVSKIAYRTIESDGTAASWTSRDIMIGYGGAYDTYSISDYDADLDTLTLTLTEANYKQPGADVANIEYTEVSDSGGTLHTYTDYLMVFCKGDKDQIDLGLYPNSIYYDTIHLNDAGGEIIGKAIGRRLKMICK